jgi:hypothetical protein
MDIRIRGASEHNLRAVDLDLPREKLIVFTGPSGSGKSSLAFDTLHAESQRRFVEALSSYVRQQFGATRKPAYELLTGLTPSIGVAQRGLVAPSPRATVATLTEIHDLLRVLWARAGASHCPNCGAHVTRTPADAVVRALLALHGARLVLCAPVARKRAGSLKPLLDALAGQGFVRVRIDGVTIALDEIPPMDARVAHDIDVVIDRIKVADDRKDRIQEAVDAALKAGHGALVAEVDGVDRVFSAVLRCLACDLDVPEPSPRLFSFNSPVGACPGCQGLGVVRTVDPDRLVDPEKSLAQGAVEGWKGAVKKALEAAAAARGIPLDVPWKALPWEHRHLLLYGDAPAPFSDAALDFVSARAEAIARFARVYSVPAPLLAGFAADEFARRNVTDLVQDRLVLAMGPTDWAIAMRTAWDDVTIRSTNCFQWDVGASNIDVQATFHILQGLDATHPFAAAVRARAAGLSDADLAQALAAYLVTPDGNLEAAAVHFARADEVLRGAQGEHPEVAFAVDELHRQAVLFSAVKIGAERRFLEGDAIPGFRGVFRIAADKGATPATPHVVNPIEEADRWVWQRDRIVTALGG